MPGSERDVPRCPCRDGCGRWLDAWVYYYTRGIHVERSETIR